MRDDSQRWAPAEMPSDPITGVGVQINVLPWARHVLMSGANVLQHCKMPLASWPDVIDGETYGLTLRRDRVIIVNGPLVADGWDADTGQAVSDMSDGYRVIEITGERAFDLLKRGTELDLNAPSRSVARMLFGIEALIYRHGNPDRFRLHVGVARFDAMVEHVRRSLTAMSQI